MEPGDPLELHGKYSFKLDGITILVSISVDETVCPSSNGCVYVSYSRVYTTSFFVSFPAVEIILVGRVVALYVVLEYLALYYKLFYIHKFLNTLRYRPKFRAISTTLTF